MIPLASSGQFIPAMRKTNKSSSCDGTSKTALVEHFFNVIFTEFHNNPPVCVCVQMCNDQPTYCYPNGCLKKVDNKKKTPEENRPAAPVNVQNDDIAKTMFLVENDFSRLLNENYENNKNAQTERSSVKDMRPDPFKDRYKSLFKYKKMPKVELRYNLREQVKNMKSDILKVETQDVSKTRWPKTNHMVLREQQTYNLGDKSNEPKSTDIGSNKFFIQGPSIERDLYSPKFFKRDLRRNLKDDIDVQSEYLTELPDPLEPKTFSLETLIDNLIGNNFARKSDGEIEFKEPHNDSQAISQIITTTENTINDTNTTKDNKEITCVVSLNMTNENLDENKYEESPIIKKHLDKWKNYTFNEMIAALSKRIEKQNNTSLEIMKDASKDNIEVTITGPMDNLKDKDNLNVIEDTNMKKATNSTQKITSTTDSNKEEKQTATVMK
ncbi:uncharacterized protein LOC135077796 [Ostrinia nubilalis]|uniref:uncharacterized protein LOC135077796 n=1 Tax=Ostrinia nubilalis TaxID=29057 RepID=UPI0030823C7E